MATAGQINILLRARTNKFKRDIKSAESTVVKFTRTLRRFTQIGAGILAAGGLLASFNATRKEIDKIGKASSRLGFGVKSLQAFARAGEMAGVETRQLFTSLQRLERRVSQAAFGMGEAQQALKDLGLNAKELRKLSPEDQFDAIAGKLKAVSSTFDKVALAQKLFDSEGVTMINVIDQLGGSIAKTTRKMDKWGQLLSENQVRSVERMNDSISRLGQAYESLKNQATGYLAAQQDVNRLAFGALTGGKAGYLEALFGMNKAAIERVTNEVNKPFEDAQRAARDTAEASNKAIEKLMKKLSTRADEIAKDVRTPFEIFKAKIAELDQLSDKGMITMQTYARAVAAAKDQLFLAAAGARELIKGQQEITKMSAVGLGREVNLGTIAAELTSRVQVGRVQKVRDPQVQETNAILRGVREDLARMVSVAISGARFR